MKASDKQVKQVLNNDGGYVLISMIVLLVIITLTVSYSSKMATSEAGIVRNDQTYSMNFYNAEGGLLSIIEDCDTLIFTDDFLNQELPQYTALTASALDDSLPEVTVDVRSINGAGYGDLDAEDQSDSFRLAAINDVPVQDHITAPPAGSGYSLKYFETRRYAVVATSGNVQVQAGVYKIFNKF